MIKIDFEPELLSTLEEVKFNLIRWIESFLTLYLDSWEKLKNENYKNKVDFFLNGYLYGFIENDKSDYDINKYNIFVSFNVNPKKKDFSIKILIGLKDKKSKKGEKI